MNAKDSKQNESVNKSRNKKLTIDEMTKELVGSDYRLKLLQDSSSALDFAQHLDIEDLMELASRFKSNQFKKDWSDDYRIGNFVSTVFRWCSDKIEKEMEMGNNWSCVTNLNFPALFIAVHRAIGIAQKIHYHFTVNFVTEDIIGKYNGDKFATVPFYTKGSYDYNVLSKLENNIEMGIPTTSTGDIIYWTSRKPLYTQHWDSGMELPVYLVVTFNRTEEPKSPKEYTTLLKEDIKAYNILEKILQSFKPDGESLEMIGERFRLSNDYYGSVIADLEI